MGTINIRPAKPEDAKAMVEIHYDAVHTTGAPYYEQEILDRWDIGVTPERIRVMERNIAQDHLVDFVAEVEGKVVGFSTFVLKNNELRAVYVLSGYGRQGVGQKLLEKVESEAKELRCPYLQLHASHNAKNFYLKNGYEARHFDTVQWGPVKMPCIIMRKVLISNFVDPIPTLETERLFIRPVTLDDVPAIFHYTKNPNVPRYTLFEPPESKKETEEFVRGYAFPNYTKNVPEPLGITLKNSPDTVIGTIGSFWESKDSGVMELAYALSEEHWGKGFIVEASHELIDFLFRCFDVNKIVARCKTPNIQSEKVMQKLGFTFEGTLRQHVYHRQRYWDMHHYSLLREEW